VVLTGLGGGGRNWWAHLRFTRINITPTIPRNQIEDDLKFWTFGVNPE
jgi:hypothetical protein